MPRCPSKYFGELEYSSDSVLTLPGGLLGFERENEFVLVQRPDQYPLVYMQSGRDADLCFLALPVLTIASDYRLELSGEDAEALEAPRVPEIGKDVLCLALVTTSADGPTANLLAPVVVNLRSRGGRQCINLRGDYSHRHRLRTAAEGAAA